MLGKPEGLSCQEDALNAQQMDKLWAACDSIRDRFIIGCLMLAGLRVSELAHLKRDWFNAEEGTLTVPIRQYCDCWECTRKRKGIWRPKTKKGLPGTRT